MNEQWWVSWTLRSEQAASYPKACYCANHTLTPHNISAKASIRLALEAFSSGGVPLSCISFVNTYSRPPIDNSSTFASLLHHLKSLVSIWRRPWDLIRRHLSLKRGAKNAGGLSCPFVGKAALLQLSLCRQFN